MEKVKSLMMIATDITERKQAEEALGESEEWLRTMIEQAPLGLTGHIYEVNARYAVIAGRTQVEMITMALALRSVSAGSPST
jgi:PAS domain-containing protein